MPVKYLSVNVKKVVGNTAIELRMETRAQMMHTDVNGLWTVFKILRPREIARWDIEKRV